MGAHEGLTVTYRTSSVPTFTFSTGWRGYSLGVTSNMT
jgi:hypothetical protein